MAARREPASDFSFQGRLHEQPSTAIFMSRFRVEAWNLVSDFFAKQAILHSDVHDLVSNHGILNTQIPFQMEGLRWRAYPPKEQTSILQIVQDFVAMHVQQLDAEQGRT